MPGSIGQAACADPSILLTLFPLFFMFNNSFKVQDEFFGNLLGSATNPILAEFHQNSPAPQPAGLVCQQHGADDRSRCGICTLIAILAAYAFAQMRFPGRDFLFNLITPLMVIPPIVMIIPMFVLFRQIHLVNNLAVP